MTDENYVKGIMSVQRRQENYVTSEQPLLSNYAVVGSTGGGKHRTKEG